MISDAPRTLNRLGQSLWLDNITRDLLDSGSALRALFVEDPGRAERFSAEGARGAEPKLAHDSSTNALINRYRRLRK